MRLSWKVEINAVALNISADNEWAELRMPQGAFIGGSAAAVHMNKGNKARAKNEEHGKNELASPVDRSRLLINEI